MPINYVLRNPHFCINSGAQFSHITPSLQELLRLQKYINNMAKRQANSATNSLDKKFEIDTDTFVVVTNFNGHLLVHIRKIQWRLSNKRRGLHVLLPILSTPGAVTEEGERNTQHGTDAHKKNKRCNNGGTTRQRILHTIEKHGRNQHAIKVNLSLIF